MITKELYYGVEPLFKNQKLIYIILIIFIVSISIPTVIAQNFNTDKHYKIANITFLDLRVNDEYYHPFESEDLQFIISVNGLSMSFPKIGTYRFIQNRTVNLPINLTQSCNLLCSDTLKIEAYTILPQRILVVPQQILVDPRNPRTGPKGQIIGPKVLCKLKKSYGKSSNFGEGINEEVGYTWNVYYDGMDPNYIINVNNPRNIRIRLGNDWDWLKRSGHFTITYRIDIKDVGNPNPPESPDLKINKIENQDIYIEWIDKSNNENEFNLFRHEGNGPWEKVYSVQSNATISDRTGTVLSRIDHNLKSSSKYTYRVQTKNCWGETYSNEVSGITWEKAPTPDIAITSTTMNQVMLKWITGTYNAKNVKIQRRSPGNQNWNDLEGSFDISGNNWRQYTDSGLKSNTEYCYKVWVKTEHHEGYSKEVCGRTKTPPPPPPPANSCPNNSAKISMLVITNCHLNRKTIHIYLNDLTAGTGWKKMGSLAQQYNPNYGNCPISDPLILTLKDGHMYQELCADCDLGENPNNFNLTCTKQYLTNAFCGSSNGVPYQIQIV